MRHPDTSPRQVRPLSWEGQAWAGSKGVRMLTLVHCHPDGEAGAVAHGLRGGGARSAAAPICTLPRGPLHLHFGNLVGAFLVK